MVLTRPEGRMQPPDWPKVKELSMMFQSSPGPKAGRNGVAYREPHGVQDVSILTRPEGRMQRVDEHRLDGPRVFQSSPGPKAGCNL